MQSVNHGAIPSWEAQERGILPQELTHLWGRLGTHRWRVCKGMAARLTNCRSGTEPTVQNLSWKRHDAASCQKSWRVHKAAAALLAKCVQHRRWWRTPATAVYPRRQILCPLIEVVHAAVVPGCVWKSSCGAGFHRAPSRATSHHERVVNPKAVAVSRHANAPGRNQRPART